MNQIVKPHPIKFAVPSLLVLAGLGAFVFLMRSQLTSDLHVGGSIGVVSAVLVFMGAAVSLLLVVTGVRHLWVLNRKLIVKENRLVLRRLGAADKVYPPNKISRVSMIPSLKAPTAYIIEFNDDEWFSADESSIGFGDGLLWLDSFDGDKRGLSLIDFDNFYVIPDWMKR